MESKGVFSLKKVYSLIIFVLKYAKKMQGLFVICIICMIALGLFPIFQLLLTKELTNALIEKKPDMVTIIYFMPFMIIQFFIWIINSSFLNPLNQVLREFIGRKLRMYISQDICVISKNVSMEEYETASFYNKYTLAYNNIGQIGSFFEVAAQLINNSITVVLAIFLLSKYSILMTVILLIVAFFQYYLNQKHKVANWSWHIKSVKENREKEYYKSVLFSRDQSKELRIFNIYNFFRGKFSERQKKLFEEQQGLVLKGSLMNFGWSSFNIIVSIIFSLYVILQLPNNNSYNVGDVLLIIGAMTSAQNYLFRSADLIAYIKKWCLDGTHVVDFFKEFKTEKKFVEILDKDNQNYSDIIEKYKEDKGIRFYTVLKSEREI